MEFNSPHCRQKVQLIANRRVATQPYFAHFIRSHSLRFSTMGSIPFAPPINSILQHLQSQPLKPRFAHVANRIVNPEASARLCEQTWWGRPLRLDEKVFHVQGRARPFVECPR